MLNKKRPQPVIWVVSGPSGSGKTSLCQALLEDARLRERFVRSVSFTTRPMRPGEKDGQDYRHITKEEFLKLRRQGAFLETQKVFDFYYGTPKTALSSAERAGRDLLLSIDVKGTERLRRVFGKARVVSVFILPPHAAALAERLARRSTENKKDIQKRLERVKMELACAKKYDYVIVNDRFADALEKIMAILTAKECEADRFDFHRS